MTITAHKVPTTEYRRGRSQFPLMATKPGQVSISIATLQTLDETEEFITALREAAKEAELPQSLKAQ